MNRALILLAAAGSVAFAQTPCEQLQSLKLPDTTITMAMTVAAGAFQNPGRPAGPATLALRCRAQGKQAQGRRSRRPGSSSADAARLLSCIRDTQAFPDSDIKIEVWLPVGAAWNGKYEAVGGGGWAGVISYPALASAVEEGYATSSTDTGHEGGNANFAVGHPEKIVDFAYRAVHEMVVQAKAVMTAYYARGPRLSYWNGCSTGGRQGLMEAQRYPDDFDGIVAGAPANYQTHLHAFDISLQTFVRQAGAAVPAAKTELVAKAVLAACDVADGVKDGLLNDPPKVQLRSGHAVVQGRRFRRLPDGAASRFGEEGLRAAQELQRRADLSGLRQGQRNGLEIDAGGPWSRPSALSLGSYREVLHQDPNWDWKTWDVDKDVPAGH